MVLSPPIRECRQKRARLIAVLHSCVPRIGLRAVDAGSAIEYRETFPNNVAVLSEFYAAHFLSPKTPSARKIILVGPPLPTLLLQDNVRQPLNCKYCYTQSRFFMKTSQDDGPNISLCGQFPRTLKNITLLSSAVLSTVSTVDPQTDNVKKKSVMPTKVAK